MTIAVLTIYTSRDIKVGLVLTFILYSAFIITFGLNNWKQHYVSYDPDCNEEGMNQFTYLDLEGCPTNLYFKVVLPMSFLISTIGTLVVLWTSPLPRYTFRFIVMFEFIMLALCGIYQSLAYEDVVKVEDLKNPGNSSFTSSPFRDLSIAIVCLRCLYFIVTTFIIALIENYFFCDNCRMICLDSFCGGCGKTVARILICPACRTQCETPFCQRCGQGTVVEGEPAQSPQAAIIPPSNDHVQLEEVPSRVQMPVEGEMQFGEM